MREWQYLLIGDTQDPDRAVARALSGGGFLVRAVLNTAVEYEARRDGTWGDSDRLLRMKYRGDVVWAAEIDPATARRVLDAWHGAGRLDRVPPVDIAIPAELDRQLDARAHRSALADVLRGHAGLTSAELGRVRSTLLDGSHLSTGWARGDGRQSSHVDDMLILLDEEFDDVVRVHRAFADLGARTLWAVSTADADTAQLWKEPASARFPNELDWLQACGSVYFATGAFLLTEPDLSAAVLSVDLHHLVAGPPGFVETVLGAAP